MNKINLVIFDYDNEYIESLSQLFNKKYYKYFKIEAINNYKQFENIISEGKKIDILLVNEAVKNEVSNLNFIKSIIYLTEKRSTQDIDSNIIYKYQSGQSIFNSIKRICKAINKDIEFEDIYDDSYLISIFSPVGGVGKTSIAISLCEKMISYGKKVLYLNMEELNCMPIFFESNSKDKNISDLFYNINEDEDCIKKIISEIINRGKNGLWYINPHNSIFDLAELTPENFINAINYLKRYSECDYIIVDLGCLFSSIYSSLIQMSDKTLLIMQQSNVALQKISSLLKQIEDLEKVNLVVNKYVKEKKLELSNELAKHKNKIMHYIELDNLMDNNDLSMEVLAGKSKFSSNMSQLAIKVLREDNSSNG